MSGLAVIITLAAGAINVNQMNRGSGISIGENSLPGWSQNGKDNYGNGQNIGANVQVGFVATVVDPDAIDNPIGEIQPSASLQNQTI
ncbi:MULTISPECIES: hypothetical protein [Paenibacillus]|uniref:hypothetical protein n=1 Tax=Paenibacillus TaxID=44249 RepID=UPI001E614709|nr:MULTISPECIES: hypothetical protein [Paenibacillus]